MVDLSILPGGSTASEVVQYVSIVYRKEEDCRGQEEKRNRMTETRK